jgi:DNA-binding response OmpR family regulator
VPPRPCNEPDTLRQPSRRYRICYRAGGTSLSTAPPTVLVVDDDPHLLVLLEAILTQRAYRVLTARDGEEGLAVARQHRPDLVLSDVKMPGMGGLALCRALRADPATRAVPVLLLSAAVRAQDVAEGLAAGAAGYLAKPYRLAELLARLERELARGDGGRPALGRPVFTAPWTGPGTS